MDAQPKYHTKACSRSCVDSPGARTVVFAASQPFSSCKFRASIVRTPFCATLWRSPCYRGHLGLSGRKLQIEFENGFPAPPAPAPGPKKSRTESKRVKIDYFSTTFSLTLFRLCFGLLGPRGRKGPGTHFLTLFATFGPKGPNDPCI